MLKQFKRFLVVAIALLAGVAADANAALMQDFEVPGLTLTRFGANSTPSIRDGVLNLTEQLNSMNNQAAFDSDGGSTGNVVVDFDFTMTNGADGFGVVLANTANHGVSGATPSFSEEANLAGSLGVGFDTFNNSGEGESSVSVHNNGALLLSTNLDGAINLESGATHHANITLSGDNLTITLTDGNDGDVIVGGGVVPGLAAYNARVVFNGRTGGANSHTRIDNLVANLDGAVTANNFDTDFLSTQNNSIPGPGIVQDATMGYALRLTDALNSQSNRVVFDTVETWGPIFDATYDFRMSPGNNSGADGHSFILLNTANFPGGEFNQGFGVEEEPNIAGSFAVGFDTFNNGAGDGGEQSVSLHFDGAQLISTDVGALGVNLEDADVQNARITLTEFGSGSLVDLSILTSGGLVQIYDDFFIEGLRPYETRIAFAGRTGGANHLTLIDNLDVQFALPEPSTGMLALLGMAGIASRRRRNA